MKALFGDDWGCHATQYSTWQAHQTGDLAILLSRGPLFFSTGPAHRLFADGRLNHVRQTSLMILDMKRVLIP